MAKKPERKKCFVVGPIGADDSEDRIHADWLLEMIIQPVFEEHFKEFDVTRADKISDPGRIDAQVISSLLDSELVIADLTTLDPNAFYEIGIRHTVQKPIIHMHLEGERIPFDIASFRSLKFDRKRPKDLMAAREALRAAVAAAIDEGHEVDNPVTFARGRVEFSKTATPTEKLFQEQLEAITKRLETIERPASSARNAIARALLSGGGEQSNLSRMFVPNENPLGVTQFHITTSLLGAPLLKQTIEEGLDAMELMIDYRVLEDRPGSLIVAIRNNYLDEETTQKIKRTIEDSGFQVRVYVN